LRQFATFTSLSILGKFQSSKTAAGVFRQDSMTGWSPVPARVSCLPAPPAILHRSI
jgi:hypothetical protein